MPGYSASGRSAAVDIFDPIAPDFDRDPNPVYHRLRRTDPVAWWPQGSSWLVTRYDDAEMVLSDHERFGADRSDWDEWAPPPPGSQLTPIEAIHKDGLFGVDPASHLRLRRLIGPFFSPAVVERWKDTISQVVDSALEGVSPGDRCDICRDVANRIPLPVLGAMLGLNGKVAAGFRDWGNAMYLSTHPYLTDSDREWINAELPKGIALLSEVIQDRRSNPQDDIITHLTLASAEEDRLTEGELISLIGGLITAGAETTVHLISFGAICLMQNPEQHALLAADHSLLPGAVEEVLRYADFGKGTYRYARQNLVLRDREIRQGQMIRVMIAAAQRDPEVYRDPDVFDIRRDNTRTLVFGRGRHFCVGYALARLEAQIVFRTLLTRFPGMKPAGPPEFKPHPRIRNLVSVPVTL